jgi:hypothetical protein
MPRSSSYQIEPSGFIGSGASGSGSGSGRGDLAAICAVG